MATASNSDGIVKTGSAWFQRKVNLRPVHRGCHLITDELLKQIPELSKFSVGLFHIQIMHTSASLALNESIYRQVLKIGLGKSYEENETVRKAVNMLMALALLPPVKVEDGLGEIKIWLEIHISSLDGNQQELMAKLLRYFETQWMGRVGARSFSVFGQKERTNNCQENFHRQLNSAMGRPHPNVWKFLGVLINVAKAEHVNLLRLNNNEQLTRPRKIKWFLQDQVILSAQKKNQCKST